MTSLDQMTCKSEAELGFIMKHLCKIWRTYVQTFKDYGAERQADTQICEDINPMLHSQYIWLPLNIYVVMLSAYHKPFSFVVFIHIGVNHHRSYDTLFQSSQ